MQSINDLSRRKFLKNTSLASIAVGLAATGLPTWAAPTALLSDGLPDFPFIQQALPYSYKDLEAAVDAQTMEIHYSKHAAAYTKNLAEAITAENVDTKKLKLEMLLSKVSKYSTKMRNNAGGHYNHEFFWQSMSPNSIKQPDGKLKDAITNDFGSFETFKTKFADAGKSRFGSGWAWLVLNSDKKLIIGSTPNQDNPIMDISELKGKPLLCLDVWEHAYYLRYQNKRADYINNWWNVVNWQFVSKIYNASV